MPPACQFKSATNWNAGVALVPLFVTRATCASPKPSIPIGAKSYSVTARSP